MTNKPEARLYETLAGMAKGRPLKMIERLCENQKTVSCARLATMIEEAQDLNREYAVAIRYSHEASRAADKARIAELTEALGNMTCAYRMAIQAGHARITSLGGDCDSVERMLADFADYGRAVELYKSCRSALAQQGNAALEPVEGDCLPQIGSKVKIHLASLDKWVDHWVVGYYAWADLNGSEYLHRVFVRVKDAEGVTNCRLLKDVRFDTAQQGKEPTP